MRGGGRVPKHRDRWSKPESPVFGIHQPHGRHSFQYKHDPDSERGSYTDTAQRESLLMSVHTDAYEVDPRYYEELGLAMDNRPFNGSTKLVTTLLALMNLLASAA